MDASPPSSFNGPAQTPWYQARGLFLDPPTLAIVNGEWRLRYTSGGQTSEIFDSVDAWLSRDRDSSSLAESYRQQIDAALADAGPSAPVGACLIEPLMQGAGGMRVVDPLFQRTLVAVCRERDISVIFDEVRRVLSLLKCNVLRWCGAC